MNKIFYIGHFKTGTMSYPLVARVLGFANLHFPLKYAFMVFEEELKW